MCQARPCIDAAVIQHQRGAASIDGETRFLDQVEREVF
jgi:hypothetical protein